VLDDRDDWSEHRPSAEDENRFIEEHGWREYGEWSPGIDDEADPETKARYKFPYGDFEAVHRCGVIAAEVRAAQREAGAARRQLRGNHPTAAARPADASRQRRRARQDEPTRLPADHLSSVAAPLPGS
jgi:hypothetical protein